MFNKRREQMKQYLLKWMGIENELNKLRCEMRTLISNAGAIELITYEIRRNIEREEFIDKIVDRILKKQLR
jgi:hypothetical protein